MTREELREHCLKQIEGCEMWARCKGEEPHGKIYEEHKLILELLEQEPTTKIEESNFSQEQYKADLQSAYDCGYAQAKNDLGVDTVSRKDVHDMLENLPVTVENKWFNWLQKACVRLAELPSVTPQEPKTGHWITKNGKEQGYDIGGLKTWYIQIMCSECGFIKAAIEGHTGQYHHCPNCGCRMESEDKK